MAKFGLICAKLRINGMHAAAEIIEKTQEELEWLQDECALLRRERDALQRECEKLLEERDELCRLVKAGGCYCGTCAHYSNQDADAGCVLEEYACEDCSRTDCYCRDCTYGDKWEWKGCDGSQQNTDN